LTEKFWIKSTGQKRNHRENTDPINEYRRGASQLGGILGGFFSLYSSFAEQCACYPYIFPTIFPHRRTTVYTDSRTVEKYREQLA
jgi:hypothetical protein